MSLSAGTRIGVYEIVSPLGEGGMGEVYRARDTRLDRHVAIKILLESFANDPDRLARFEREAKLLASLNHPHIAQIFYHIGDRMMAVAVTAAGNELQLSAPRQLFARPYAYGAGITIANYDVTKDGQRFVMVRDDTTVARLRVILNWRADTTAAPAPAR